LRTKTRSHEDGIVSNRKLACYGECYIKLCTHRPSRSKNCIDQKLNEKRIFAKKTNLKIRFAKTIILLKINNKLFIDQGRYGNLSEVETR